MPNFINNAIAQLFDHIFDYTHVNLATFTTNDRPPETKSINSNQKYMKKFDDEYVPQPYKYLYDPSLAFDFRFHQRLSRFTYEERKKDWISLIFNSSANRPLNNVLSHVYDGLEYVTYGEGEEARTEAVKYIFRRVLTPINFTLISNNISYLYENTEKLAMYFDRIINFPYKVTLNFSETHAPVFDLVGMATDIRQIDVNKLSTESRGSLVMSGFSFNLLHYVVILPDERYRLLERVIVEVKDAVAGAPLFIFITE